MPVTLAVPAKLHRTHMHDLTVNQADCMLSRSPAVNPRSQVISLISMALRVVVVRLGGTDVPAPAHLRWQPLLEPGCGGAITALAIGLHDGRRVLVGGDMLGIGVSEDRGEHWQSSFDLPSYEIADSTFNPIDPQAIRVGTLSGPRVSTDGDASDLDSDRAGLQNHPHESSLLGK